MKQDSISQHKTSVDQRRKDKTRQYNTRHHCQNQARYEQRQQDNTSKNKPQDGKSRPRLTNIHTTRDGHTIEKNLFHSRSNDYIFQNDRCVQQKDFNVILLHITILLVYTMLRLLSTNEILFQRLVSFIFTFLLHFTCLRRKSQRLSILHCSGSVYFVMSPSFISTQKLFVLQRLRILLHVSVEILSGNVIVIVTVTYICKFLHRYFL